MKQCMKTTECAKVKGGSDETDIESKLLKRLRIRCSHVSRNMGRGDLVRHDRERDACDDMTDAYGTRYGTSRCSACGRVTNRLEKARLLILSDAPNAKDSCVEDWLTSIQVCAYWVLVYEWGLSN